LKPQLETVDWYTDRWLEECTQPAYISFDRACERWRGLFQISQRTGG